MTRARKLPKVTALYTIGHSTHTIEEFIALLKQVQVTRLVDIRTIARSRTNPQFNEDVLPIALQAVGITYCHLSALGGLRHHKKDAPPSPNLFWRVAAFRNYADYAMTAFFRAGLEELLALTHADCCAIMCAEAVWWRCHRRIVTDYLLAAHVPVFHIMGLKHVDPAQITPGAHVQPDGTLLYPAAKDTARLPGV